MALLRCEGLIVLTPVVCHVSNNFEYTLFICIDLAQRLSQNRYIDQKTVRFFVSAN